MKQLFFAITLAFLSACAPSDGTSTGNPLVSLKIDSFNSALSQKTAATAAAVDTLAMSSLKFCFKRLRFKQLGDSSGSSSGNQDFYLGEVSISNLGTELAGVTLPAGTYTRLEFDLDPSCPSGKSVQLTNSHGSFSTDQTITIRFDGTFVHSSSDEILNLNIQQIVSSLNSVTSDSSIRTQAEGASGSF